MQSNRFMFGFFKLCGLWRGQNNCWVKAHRAGFPGNRRSDARLFSARGAGSSTGAGGNPRKFAVF